MAETLDPARCPLCGESNGCAMAADPDATTCWCFSATIGPDVLERVAAEAQGLVCVCARCASGAEPRRG